eukprot:15116972-Alexandrium_andersonii.AAC.1
MSVISLSLSLSVSLSNSALASANHRCQAHIRRISGRCQPSRGHQGPLTPMSARAPTSLRRQSGAPKGSANRGLVRLRFQAEAEA